MTTVVYYDGVMIGDGKVSNDRERAIGTTTKIFRLSNGGLLGFAADPVHAQVIEIFEQAFVEDHVPEMQELFFVEALELIYVSPDGRVTLYDIDRDENGVPSGSVVEVNTMQPAVIGSGGELALAAWLADKDLLKAVAIACQLDNNSGPPLTVLKLEKVGD